MIPVRQTQIPTRNNSVFASWLVVNCGLACKIGAWKGVLYTVVGLHRSSHCITLQARQRAVLTVVD